MVTESDAAPRAPEVAPGARGGRRDLGLAWLAGAVAALAVVGPGLAPGAWLNVDLVITPVTPVPSGVWGIGPELPRRVPFMIPFAWLSALVPSELPLKLAVVVALAATVAGAWRLVGRWDPTSPVVARLAAGLILGVGPFAVTRAGIGHLGLTFALALLPWALPSLLRPLERIPVTVAWCLALAACGPFGGTLALPAVAIGLLTTPATRPWARARALALAVAAQGPWLVPTAVVALLGTQVGAAGDFATDAGGPGGPFRILAGHGFWLPDSEIGRSQGWEVPLAGVVLAGLAVVGVRRLPAAVRRPAALLATLGLLGAAASALPGLDRAFAWTTERSVLVALREGQRLLALYLVVVAPVAALGAVELARRARGWLSDVVVVVPLALAAVLMLPGLWGAEGGLDPVTLPASWAQVRGAVRADPGTVVVVPWRSYPVVPLDGLRRRVLNPMPLYLGGDVIASSDPGFDDGTRERNDPREARAEVLAERIAEGEDVGPELADLGVRWVVGLAVAGGEPASMEGRGLRPVVVTSEITLHEVPGWVPARTAAGDPVEVSRPVAPVMRVGAARTRVAAPGSAGWWRGGHQATSVGGLLEVPAGSGPVFYPAAAAVLAADALALGLACWSGRRWWTQRARRSTRSGG